MADLKDREIFSVGTWNGLTFTEEDLDDIVENFNKFNDAHKVPLKFGHNDKQEITDGQPAIGWISRIYRNGKKLFADFSDMPKVVFDAIKKRLYRTVSVELLFGVKKDGKRFNHILDAVALLGADKPAVSNLADLNALLASRADFDGGRRFVFDTVKGKKQSNVNPEDDEDDEMPIKEEDFNKLVDSVGKLEAKIDEKDEKITALEAENKKLKGQAESFSKKEAEKKIEMARKSVKEVLDAAVKQKKLDPAGREAFEAQFGVEDDEKVVQIDVENIKKMFSVKKLDTKEVGLDDDDEEFSNPEEQLERLVRENMAKSGETDFAKVFMSTARANPKLHKAYLDMNGEV